MNEDTLITRFDQYEGIVRPLAVYPNLGNNFTYPALGLCGEAGEVAEKVKKVLRDDNGVFTEEKRQAALKELGDVLWYLSATAIELGSTLEEVAQLNVKKLLDRNRRGTLHGQGDDR